MEIVWKTVGATAPGVVLAENASADGKQVRVRMRSVPDGWKVTISFYAGGQLLERWCRTYRVRGHADNGYRQVKDRAERWLSGFGLRGLRPQGWQADRGENGSDD